MSTYISQVDTSVMRGCWSEPRMRRPGFSGITTPTDMHHQRLRAQVAPTGNLQTTNKVTLRSRAPATDRRGKSSGPSWAAAPRKSGSHVEHHRVLTELLVWHRSRFEMETLQCTAPGFQIMTFTGNIAGTRGAGEPWLIDQIAVISSLEAGLPHSLQPKSLLQAILYASE